MPDASFLAQKLGPLPVYAWAGGGLGAALLVAKFRTAKQEKAATQQQAPAVTTYASSPEGVAPQFVIQNQLPWYPPPSSPVQPPVTAPPVITPPGTSTNPPAPDRANPPVSGGPIAQPGHPPPAQTTPRAPQTYTVQHNDTLSAIAKRYGTTWEALYAYNTTPGNRSADAIAKFRKQGPNLIYAGQKILIP